MEVVGWLISTEEVHVEMAASLLWAQRSVRGTHFADRLREQGDTRAGPVGQAERPAKDPQGRARRSTCRDGGR